MAKVKFWLLIQIVPPFALSHGELRNWQRICTTLFRHCFLVKKKQSMTTIHQVWSAEIHTQTRNTQHCFCERADAAWYQIQTWSHEIQNACCGGKPGQTRRCRYSGGSQATFAMPHLQNPPRTTPPSPWRPSPKWSTEPVISTLVLVVGRGGGGIASQLTWRGSHGDKSQFTQGAVTLDDIFTGCLYSSFDNAPATSFISLKDESKAGNVISPLRQGRRRRRIKEEGGAS